MRRLFTASMFTLVSLSLAEAATTESTNPRDWDTALTLQSSTPKTPVATQVDPAWDQPGLLSLNLPPELKSGKPSPSGLDASPVFDDATAVEYRSHQGIGAGFTSNVAWCISESISLASNLNLYVYYLQGIRGPLLEESAKHFNTDPAAVPTGQAMGLNLQWKF